MNTIDYDAGEPRIDTSQPRPLMARDELLDIKQAAQFLKVSETSLRRWTNAGRLACLRVGLKRERRFRPSDLLAFMESQPAGGGGPGGAVEKRQQTVVAGIPLPYGTHLCALYGNDAGRDRLAVSFLADGFQSGTVCFLNSSPEVRTHIIGQFPRGRGSLESEMKEKRLVVTQPHHGVRDQYDYWEASFISAMRGGAHSLRVVGDMTSCLDAGMSLDDIVEYEAGYDRLIARRFPVVSLCLYDVRRFESLEVVRALKGHGDTFRYPAERLLA